MQLPAQSKTTQINAKMGRSTVWRWQVVVAQQGRNMFTASLALCGITHHHHMRDGYGSRHRLWRAGVDFVVQGNARWVLWNMKVCSHK
jgi:hypothetical protein